MWTVYIIRSENIWKHFELVWNYFDPFCTIHIHFSWPYRIIEDNTGPYRTIRYNTWPYRTKPGPYATIRDHTGPYGTLLDHTGPYWTIQDRRRPYRTIGDHTGPYRNIFSQVLVSLFVCLFLCEFSIPRVAHATKNKDKYVQSMKWFVHAGS